MVPTSGQGEAGGVAQAGPKALAWAWLGGGQEKQESIPETTPKHAHTPGLQVYERGESPPTGP